jgi:hypothetical protein
LYTTWRHPGLSFVYKTSLTFRWLMTMIANCHLLTTPRRTGEGRGKNKKQKQRLSLNNLGLSLGTLFFSLHPPVNVDWHTLLILMIECFKLRFRNII